MAWRSSIDSFTSLQGENVMAVRTWDQKVKNVVRKEVLKERGNSVKTALFMPADTAYCVEEAKNSGLINDETELILVDKDSTTLSLGYNRCVDGLGHQDDWIQLRRGKVEDVLRDLRPENVAVTDGWCDYLEFLYLDTCGELSPTMVDSLEIAAKNKVITEKTTIAFTFSTAQRMWDTSYATHFVKDRPDFCHCFSENEKRNRVCNTLAQTIKHATGRAFSRIAFGCAYKEMGGGFPMMTAVLPGKSYKWDENIFADLGYNGNRRNYTL
jgi:hypothetical protein